MHAKAASSLVVRHSSFLLALFIASACSGDPTTAPDLHFASMHITLKGKPLTLEVADSEAKRERGLMFRESMPADHGMLFVFDAADNYRFWMKNTLIPLDILFLDSTGKIIAIRTMKPNDETPVGCDAPSLFAIELNGGAAKSLGLSAGDAVSLPDKFLKQPSHSDDK